MKRSILLFALCALALLGCDRATDPIDNTNNTEENLNQPKYPSTWSPVGHVYVCDRSNDNPEGYEWAAEVLDFISKDSVYHYGTINSDYSQTEGFHLNRGGYEIIYPALTIFWGGDHMVNTARISFSDTITIQYYDYTYSLIR